MKPWQQRRLADRLALRELQARQRRCSHTYQAVPGKPLEVCPACLSYRRTKP